MTRPTSKMTGNPFFAQLSEYYLLSMIPVNYKTFLSFYNADNDDADSTYEENARFALDLWNASALMGGEL